MGDTFAAFSETTPCRGCSAARNMASVRVGGVGISQPATQPANDALMLSNRRNRTNRFSLPGINHMGRRFTFHRRPGETRLSCGLDVLLESVLLKLDPRLRRGRLQVSPAVE